MVRQQYSEDDLPSDELRQQFMGQVGLLAEEDKRQLISEVLTPNGFNLIVTPKEIDTAMEDLATLISNGINRALHQNVQFS